MKNSQKGFAIPLIIAIIAVLAAGGGVYVYQNVKNSKSATGGEISTDQKILNNISACDSKNDSREKDVCYEEIAIKNTDSNICLKITKPSTIDHCLVGVAALTKDISLCSQVKSNSTRNICFGYVAVATKNLSFCDMVVKSGRPYPFEDNSDLCYTNVANELKDVSVCEKIKIPTEQYVEYGPLPKDFQGGRVYCYERLAKSLNDKTICSKIISETMRNECVAGVSVNNQNSSTTTNSVVPANELKPSITSISKSSGPIGTTIEIKGYNLLDARGDQNVIIQGPKGETASFGSGDPTHIDLSKKYTSMKLVLNDKICNQWATDAGFPCKTWMTIVPGEYQIYVDGIKDSKDWNKPFLKSNKVKFIVTANSISIADWKTYSDPIQGVSFKYPPDWTYQKFSCNLDGVAFCPLAGNNPSNCSMTCSLNHVSIPVIFYEYAGDPTTVTLQELKTWTQPSLALGDNKYKSVYDKMVGTFESKIIQSQAKLFIEQMQKDLGTNYEVKSSSKSVNFPGLAGGGEKSVQKTLVGYSFSPLPTPNLDQYFRSKMQVDSYNSGDATYKGSMAYKNDSVICVDTSITKTSAVNGNIEDCLSSNSAPQCYSVREVFCADLNQ